MALLLIVMVGKFTEWVPGLSGLPLAKIAFFFTAVYAYRVRDKLVPVRVRSLRIAKPALAFFVLQIVSVFFSIYKSNTLISSQASFIYLVAFVVLVKITQSLRDVERMLVALAISAVSLALGVLFNYGGGRAHINANFDPNDIAYALDTLLPMVVALGVAESKRRKWLAYGIALVMVLVILLTGSRGGALGLGVVVLAMTAYPFGFAKKTGALRGFAPGGMLVKLAFLGLLGVIAWGNLPGETQERLQTLLDLEHDYNADPNLNSSRTVLWKRDIGLALERPIGYGMGSAPAADGMAGGQFRTAHNSFVQAFIELGVLGLLLYVYSYFITWKELGKIAAAGRRPGVDHETAKAALYARALRVGLAGNLVSGFFLSQAYSSVLWMVVAICAAFVRIAGPDAASARGGAAA
jgi:O-antigen ligase